MSREGAREGESLVKIAVVQMEPRVGEKKSNIDKSLKLIDECAEKGARIVVLPELCNSGYVFSSRTEAFEMAEPVEDGETIGAWQDRAKQHGLYLLAGFCERAGSKLFNSAVLIGPDGLQGVYRKAHLWYEEKLFFEAGDLGFPVFNIPYGRIAMLICYDLNYAEAFRIVMEQGADLVCVPMNWVPDPPPLPSHDKLGNSLMNYLQISRSYDNAFFVAVADRVGVERGVKFAGASMISGTRGWPIAGPASTDREEILISEMNLADARRDKKITRLNDIIRDRRSDLYDPMLGYRMHPRLMQ